MTAIQTIDTTNATAVEAVDAAITQAKALTPTEKLLNLTKLVDKNQTRLATLQAQAAEQNKAYEDAKTALVEAVTAEADVMEASRALQSAKTKMARIKEQVEELLKEQVEAVKGFTSLVNAVKAQINEALGDSK